MKEDKTRRDDQEKATADKVTADKIKADKITANKITGDKVAGDKAAAQKKATVDKDKAQENGLALKAIATKNADAENIAVVPAVDHVVDQHAAHGTSNRMAASQVVDQSMHGRDSDKSCETELAKAPGKFKPNLKRKAISDEDSESDMDVSF